MVSDSARSDPEPKAAWMAAHSEHTFRSSPRTLSDYGTPKVVATLVVATQPSALPEPDADVEETLGRDPALVIHNHKPLGAPLRRFDPKWFRAVATYLRRHFRKSALPATAIILVGGLMYGGGNRHGGGGMHQENLSSGSFQYRIPPSWGPEREYSPSRPRANFFVRAARANFWKKLREAKVRAKKKFARTFFSREKFGTQK